jgi:hypothetical protein
MCLHICPIFSSEFQSSCTFVRFLDLQGKNVDKLSTEIWDIEVLIAGGDRRHGITR